MATNRKQTGDILNWTNDTSTAVSSGDVVVIGDRIGVAVTDIAADAAGALDVWAVYSLAANSAQSWSMGDLLYWDATNSELTTTAGANVTAGYAAADKAALATTATVKLNG